ncbi:MAG: GNAT family protein [Bacillota bacterium]
MSYYKKIVGEKVYLSPIDPNDHEKFTEWLNDLGVTLHLNLSPQVITLEKEKEIIEKMTRDGPHFSLIDLDHDELIGTGGLLNVNHINRCAELGTFIGNKNYWGQGYGTEAVQLLLDFAFNLLNLNSIYLFTFSFNHRAIKCYEKCGFKEVGRRREGYLVGANKYDVVIMDILASEFTGKIPGYLDNLYHKK